MNQEELLWKYAEGSCDAPEKALAEQLLAEHPELQKELDLIREVHAGLGELEAESPSMRFAQNVMEELPARLYPPLSAGALVGPFWKKLFWGSLTFLFGMVVLGTLLGNPSSSSLPYTEQAVQALNGLLAHLSPTVVQFTGLTLLALLALALADRFLLSKTAAVDD